MNNLKSQDVQKILNLKHAWEFILDEDVIKYTSDFDLLCAIAKTINEGFLYNGGQPRLLPVEIGGTTYKPPIPDPKKIKTELNSIMSDTISPQEKAVLLCLFCMKIQVFQDGNKRSSVIFANHFLISNGGGLLIINEKKVPEFKNLLIDYYEDKNKKAKDFLINNCLITIL